MIDSNKELMEQLSHYTDEEMDALVKRRRLIHYYAQKCVQGFSEKDVTDVFQD